MRFQFVKIINKKNKTQKIKETILYIKKKKNKNNNNLEKNSYC